MERNILLTVEDLDYFSLKYNSTSKNHNRNIFMKLGKLITKLI